MPKTAARSRTNPQITHGGITKPLCGFPGAAGLAALSESLIDGGQDLPGRRPEVSQRGIPQIDAAGDRRADLGAYRLCRDERGDRPSPVLDQLAKVTPAVPKGVQLH